MVNPGKGSEFLITKVTNLYSFKSYSFILQKLIMNIVFGSSQGYPKFVVISMPKCGTKNFIEIIQNVYVYCYIIIYYENQ